MRSTITLVWNQVRPHDRPCGGIVTASRLPITNAAKFPERSWEIASLLPTTRKISLEKHVIVVRHTGVFFVEF
jgi:hypothetical protein